MRIQFCKNCKKIKENSSINKCPVCKKRFQQYEIPNPGFKYKYIIMIGMSLSILVLLIFITNIKYISGNWFVLILYLIIQISSIIIPGIIFKYCKNQYYLKKISEQIEE